MIYLFYGTDTERTRTKAFEWIAKARTKEPNLAYVRLSREETTPAALEDATASGGLFVKRILVLIDDPFPKARETEEGEEDAGTVYNALEDLLDSLAGSDNAIVLLAPKLDAQKAKKILTKSKIAYKYDLHIRAQKEKRGFNAGLVNALATRSRENLWIEIVRALRAGDAPEMVHGLLHWKARDLMEKGGKGWGPNESRRLSLRLIEILQSSRRGGSSLDRALERFALSL